MNASKELLYKHVEFLTTLRPFRNYQNLESLAKVCHYLKREFEKNGLEPVEQKFTAQGSEYKNIIEVDPNYWTTGLRISDRGPCSL